MKKFTRISIFVLLITSMMLTLATSISAQSPGVSTLTISESFINEAIQANNQNPDADLSLDLQPGQIVVELVTTGRNGNTTVFTLTLVPSVTPDGKLDFEATKLTINDLEIPLNNNNNNQAIDAASDAVGGFLNEQTDGGQIQSITVAEDRISVEWINNDPNAPTVTIRDTLFSLTFTEENINQMDWVTNPSDPTVTGIYVDLQQGQGVINITRSVEPTAVSYVIIPTVVNGFVTWQVNAQADTEGSVVSSLLTIWRGFFGGVYGDNSMTNAVVTDNTVTFTWDLTDIENAERTDSIVTYTITEDEVNAAFAAFITDELTALSVDMQPGRLIVNASGVNESGVSYTASLTLLPVLSGGQVTWEVESFSINGFVVDNNKLQASNNATSAITQGLNSTQRGSGTVTDFEINDTMITFTVHYR